MIQQIIDGIVAALRTAFPEVARVYTEEVKQGFKEPCFVLCLLKSTYEQFLGNRYYLTNLFSVQYFPDGKSDVKAECYSIADRLFRALEYIKTGDDLQRGVNKHSEEIDGTLKFFVNFNGFAEVKSEVELMEQLAVTILEN